MVVTASRLAALLLLLMPPVTGAMTPTHRWQILSGSSVYGGQGSDDISAANDRFCLLPDSNLGNDTINLGSVAEGASIFGGGGFLFDTSTDGADSLTIAGNLVLVP